MALIKVKTDGVDNTVNLGRRNLIINGAMEIDQRNTLGSANTSAASSFVKSVDGNWFCIESTDGQCSYEQVVDAPAGTGLRFSQKVTVTSTDTSLAAAQRFVPTQGTEGYTWNNLMWHTSNAKNVAVQFWVKSSVTGTYGFTIRTGGAGYSYCQPYTISSANTWEKKTFIISAPTSLPNGSVSNTNGVAYYLIFGLGLGSDFDVGADEIWTNVANGQGRTSHTNLLATNGATWQLTGFQIEAGDTSTPFEHLSYGEELSLCQRYYFEERKPQYGTFAVGRVFNSQTPQFDYKFPTPMRTLPSVSNVGSGCGAWYASGSFAQLLSPAYYQEDSSKENVSTVSLIFAQNASLTDNNPIALSSWATNSGLSFSAEL
jgi:hypothetical protein